MKLDREMALEAMKSMGWTATRKVTTRKMTTQKDCWHFTRPRRGHVGEFENVTCKNLNLGMAWVADIAMQHGDADELVREVLEAKERWLKARFLGIFTRAEGRA